MNNRENIVDDIFQTTRTGGDFSSVTGTIGNLHLQNGTISQACLNYNDYVTRVDIGELMKNILSDLGYVKDNNLDTVALSTNPLLLIDGINISQSSPLNIALQDGLRYMNTIIDSDRFTDVKPLIEYFITNIAIGESTIVRQKAMNLLILLTTMYILAASNGENNNINVIMTVHTGIIENFIRAIGQFRLSEDITLKFTQHYLPTFNYGQRGQSVTYHNFEISSRYANSLRVVFIDIDQSGFEYSQKKELDDYLLVTLGCYIGLLSGMNLEEQSMYPVYFLSHDKYNWLSAEHNIFNYFNNSIRGKINIQSSPNFAISLQKYSQDMPTLLRDAHLVTWNEQNGVYTFMMGDSETLKTVGMDIRFDDTDDTDGTDGNNTDTNMTGGYTKTKLSKRKSKQVRKLKTKKSLKNKSKSFNRKLKTKKSLKNKSKSFNRKTKTNKTSKRKLKTLKK
jgi:hypothetical protein